MKRGGSGRSGARGSESSNDGAAETIDDGTVSVGMSRRSTFPSTGGKNAESSGYETNNSGLVVEHGNHAIDVSRDINATGNGQSERTGVLSVGYGISSGQAASGIHPNGNMTVDSTRFQSSQGELNARNAMRSHTSAGLQSSHSSGSSASTSQSRLVNVYVVIQVAFLTLLVLFSAPFSDFVLCSNTKKRENPCRGS